MNHARSPQKTIILIDILEENYSFTELYHTIIQFVSHRCCPCCTSVGRYRRHGRYEKYHYQTRISIVRVKCGGCGTTHAVIPSFSLPGTSVGTGEVEQYVKNRHGGMSRGKAAEVFEGLCLNEEYPKQLERMFEAAVLRAKVLLENGNTTKDTGYAWVLARVGEETQRPLWELNILCGSRGCNPVFFSRSSILFFRKLKTGIRISHNLPSARTARMVINSS